MNLDSGDIANLLKYLHPASKVVTSLPNAKEVKDMTIVFKRNSDGTYNQYQMVEGNWILIASNLTKE